MKLLLLASLLSAVLSSALAATPSTIPKRLRQCQEALDTLNAGVLSIIKRNAFSVGRQLRDYAQVLHPEFLKDLNSLGTDDIILDGGAGRAYALMEYLYDDEVSDFPTDSYLAMEPLLKRKATAVAIAFKRPAKNSGEDHSMRKIADKDSRFQYIEGDIGFLLKNHPELVGKVSLITDVYGILKYSQFQEVLGIYLTLLKIDGKIYFNSPDVEIEHNRKPVSIVKYLSAVKGIQLKFEPGPYNSQYSREQNGTFVMEKISNNIEVPELSFVSADMDEQSGGTATYIWP